MGRVFFKLTFFFLLFFRVLYFIICSVTSLVFLLHCLLLSSISFYNDIIMNLFFPHSTPSNFPINLRHCKDGPRQSDVLLESEFSAVEIQSQLLLFITTILGCADVDRH